MRVRFERRRPYGAGVEYHSGSVALFLGLWHLMLEWRLRVRCTAIIFNRRCRRPATIKCVSKAGVGDDFARDAMCDRHGKLGLCPTNQGSLHLSIPPAQLYAYNSDE